MNLGYTRISEILFLSLFFWHVILVFHEKLGNVTNEYYDKTNIERVIYIYMYIRMYNYSATSLIWQL